MKKYKTLKAYHEINHKLLRELPPETGSEKKHNLVTLPIIKITLGIAAAAAILFYFSLAPQEKRNKIEPAILSAPLKAPFEIIEDMGKQQAENALKIQKEAARAIKNHRPMKNALAKDELDMPPWDHPHRWGMVKSEHGTCWYHNDTMRKVCSDNKPSTR